MVDPLRIVFLGTPAFAVPTLRHLLASRHQVCGVITQPDRPRGRGQKVIESPVKALAVESGLPLIQPPRIRTPDVGQTIREWRPDLGVVAAYGQLIPEELLAIPRLGMINVHASLLPKYRGAAPVHRAVIDGEPETGVTIMRVVKALDSGNMLATYAPRLTKEEGVIDWTLPAVFIHNRVRGLYPWPHAYTYLDGQRLILLRTHVETGAPSALAPGTIVEVSRDAIHVTTGQGGRIAISELQREGGKPLIAHDFLAGYAIAPGSVLTGA